MKADIVTKNYLKDPYIFADIFNYYIYGGKQVIKPNELTERDTAKIALPYGSDGEAVAVQKFRDVQKLYAAKTDGKALYILFGIESQANVHLAMPVRNGLYDMMDYASQVEQIAKLHKRNDKRKKKPDKDEFLSGFWREDRLIPSITLTIYFSPEPWDAPLSLSEMMGEMSPQTRAFLNDYRIHLMAPAQMSDDEIMQLDSSMREVLLFIKYSKDNKSLEKIVQSEDRFKGLERRAADVIEVITKSGLKFKPGEEVVDMCEAIKQIRLESERVGEERGILIGEKLGEERGKLIGKELGEIDAKKSVAENLYTMGLTLDKIAQALGETIETIKEWLKCQ